MENSNKKGPEKLEHKVLNLNGDQINKELLRIGAMIKLDNKEGAKKTIGYVKKMLSEYSLDEKERRMYESELSNIEKTANPHKMTSIRKNFFNYQKSMIPDENHILNDIKAGISSAKILLGEADDVADNEYGDGWKYRHEIVVDALSKILDADYCLSELESPDKKFKERDEIEELLFGCYSKIRDIHHHNARTFAIGGSAEEMFNSMKKAVHFQKLAEKYTIADTRINPIDITNAFAILRTHSLPDYPKIDINKYENEVKNYLSSNNFEKAAETESDNYVKKAIGAYRKISDVANKFFGDVKR